MLVASPAPGLAAEWHRALNVAAAKLAVAAGVAPAEVRRVSGLRRVEISRSPAQVRRQMAALKEAAKLTEDQLCGSLVDEVETVDRILSGKSADEIGMKYLQICRQARRYERLHWYFDHVEAFNREFVALTAEFERCRRKFRELGEQYDFAGERLCAAASLSRDASWNARRAALSSIDRLVAERDSTRAALAFTSKQVATTMDKYRRHQARRAFFHSLKTEEFRDPRNVFVPGSTLQRMTACRHEEVKALSHAIRENALRLMGEWNGICEQYAVERRQMLLQHNDDELRDHTMRLMASSVSPATASRLSERRTEKA